MTAQRNRREFITLLGGAATWPLPAHTQQRTVPVIGVLSILSPNDSRPLMTAFRQGLQESGYIEGQNVAIAYRFAEARPERLPALAADLVNRPVDAILTSGGTVAAMVAKSATRTIPIVFNIGADPVRAGLVASLNRPGGNVTGVSWLSITLTGKRFELLHDILPKSISIAFLDNSVNPNINSNAEEAEAAARSLGLSLNVVTAKNEQDIDAVFAALAEQRINALVVTGDPLFITRKNQLVALAARHSICTIYALREFTTAGGLMSYSPSYIDVHRQCADYVARILKGAKPADLPVQQSSKFEFVINLKTAKALGLHVPPTLFAFADEVIE
jgi:putative tryptophan/tyrosine transport system substrate-binding protein